MTANFLHVLKMIWGPILNNRTPQSWTVISHDSFMCLLAVSNVVRVSARVIAQTAPTAKMVEAAIADGGEGMLDGIATCC